jgi:serine O-acetyltransferase
MDSIRDHRIACSRNSAIGRVMRKAAVFRHRFWSVVTGADIPLNARHVSLDLELPHPNGVVIHPDVVIGPACRIFQQVTLGTGPIPGVPCVGSGVWIGAGARILGGITIGDGAVVGANAVVLHDVPEGAVAAGVPAVIKVNARRGWDARQRSGS